MKLLKIVSLGVAMLISLVTLSSAGPRLLADAGNTSSNKGGLANTVSGTVSDYNGTLSGVSISVEGKSISATTDIDGKYSIEATEGETLVFSYLGYKAQRVKIGKSTKVNVVMEEENQTLEEVVVTAYDARLKRASRDRSKEDRSSARATAPAAAKLQGKVSGIQVNAAKVASASTTRVTLRGNRSQNGSSQAMVVIDGKVSSMAEYQNLPPERISNVNLLKGAQGAALYGTQGGNGVIVVSTVKAGNAIPSVAEPDQEDYDSFVENAFTSPKNEPLSTFSIDVDNASYTNVRRFLNNGQKVPRDAVRVEEMVNFFKYDYPQPAGEHPFSIATEVTECPWNSGSRLVKIGLQGKKIPTDDLPASNFVFLIDVSGSMSDYNKLPLLKASMKLLVAQLREQDKVAMVVYAGAAGLVLPPTRGSEKDRILAALDKLEAGGSTAGGAGIELAYKTASENFIRNGNNRIILATDGDFNVGNSSNSDMEKLIEEKRKTGVFLTVLGYGMGNYKDSKMEILADKGNGNYAYIDNIQEAGRILVKEFGGSMYAIAKDVKIQIEFNPKHVQSYRLIGYENRKLRPEDFANDAIDAGELGSGHNVTALYEVIPQGVKSEFFTESTNLKYTDQKNVDPKFKDELATVKFRYKKPDGDKSTEMAHVIGDKSEKMENASADMKFASAVAWFGLKLRESKLVANVSSDDIRKLAKQGLSNDKDGYRAEFVRLVESAQTLGYAKN